MTQNETKPLLKEGEQNYAQGVPIYVESYQADEVERGHFGDRKAKDEGKLAMIFFLVGCCFFPLWIVAMCKYKKSSDEKAQLWSRMSMIMFIIFCSVIVIFVVISFFIVLFYPDE